MSIDILSDHVLITCEIEEICTLTLVCKDIKNAADRLCNKLESMPLFYKCESFNEYLYHCRSFFSGCDFPINPLWIPNLDSIKAISNNENIDYFNNENMDYFNAQNMDYFKDEVAEHAKKIHNKYKKTFLKKGNKYVRLESLSCNNEIEHIANTLAHLLSSSLNVNVINISESCDLTYLWNRLESAENHYQLIDRGYVKLGESIGSAVEEQKYLFWCAITNTHPLITIRKAHGTSILQAMFNAMEGYYEKTFVKEYLDVFLSTEKSLSNAKLSVNLYEALKIENDPDYKLHVEFNPSESGLFPTMQEESFSRSIEIAQTMFSNIAQTITNNNNNNIINDIDKINNQNDNVITKCITDLTDQLREPSSNSADIMNNVHQVILSASNNNNNNGCNQQ